MYIGRKNATTENEENGSFTCESISRDGIKEIHVYFSTEHKSAFEYFVSDERLNGVWERDSHEYEIGEDYERICLSYELCMGDISNPPFSNAELHRHFFGSAEAVEKKNKRQIEKLQNIGNTVPVYLWLDGDSSNGLMNLLYFSAEFFRFDTVYLVRWIHTEKNFDGSLRSMLEALKGKVILTALELEAMSKRFAIVQELHAECLLGDSENIVPWSYEKLEECVLKSASRRYRGVGSIYVDTLKAVKKETSYNISYNAVLEAVYRLTVQGKLESNTVFCPFDRAIGELAELKFRIPKKRKGENHSGGDKQ